MMPLSLDTTSRMGSIPFQPALCGRKGGSLNDALDILRKMPIREDERGAHEKSILGKRDVVIAHRSGGNRSIASMPHASSSADAPLASNSVVPRRARFSYTDLLEARTSNRALQAEMKALRESLTTVTSERDEIWCDVTTLMDDNEDLASSLDDLNEKYEAVLKEKQELEEQNMQHLNQQGPTRQQMMMQKVKGAEETPVTRSSSTSSSELIWEVMDYELALGVMKKESQRKIDSIETEKLEVVKLMKQYHDEAESAHELAQQSVQKVNSLEKMIKHCPSCKCKYKKLEERSRCSFSKNTLKNIDSPVGSRNYIGVHGGLCSIADSTKSENQYKASPRTSKAERPNLKKMFSARLLSGGSSKDHQELMSLLQDRSSKTLDTHTWHGCRDQPSVLANPPEESLGKGRDTLKRLHFSASHIMRANGPSETEQAMLAKKIIEDFSKNSSSDTVDLPGANGESPGRSFLFGPRLSSRRNVSRESDSPETIHQVVIVDPSSSCDTDSCITMSPDDFDQDQEFIVADEPPQPAVLGMTRVANASDCIGRRVSNSRFACSKTGQRILQLRQDHHQ